MTCNTIKKNRHLTIISYITNPVVDAGKLNSIGRANPMSDINMYEIFCFVEGGGKANALVLKTPEWGCNRCFTSVQIDIQMHNPSVEEENDAYDSGING